MIVLYQGGVFAYIYVGDKSCHQLSITRCNKWYYRPLGRLNSNTNFKHTQGLLTITNSVEETFNVAILAIQVYWLWEYFDIPEWPNYFTHSTRFLSNTIDIKTEVSDIISGIEGGIKKSTNHIYTTTPKELVKLQLELFIAAYIAQIHLVHIQFGTQHTPHNLYPYNPIQLIHTIQGITGNGNTSNGVEHGGKRQELEQLKILKRPVQFYLTLFFDK